MLLVVLPPVVPPIVPVVEPVPAPVEPPIVSLEPPVVPPMLPPMLPDDGAVVEVELSTPVLLPRVPARLLRPRFDERD